MLFKLVFSSSESQDILGGTTEDKMDAQLMEATEHSLQLFAESFVDPPLARLLAMISESNAQKTRYEMEDDPKVAV